MDGSLFSTSEGGVEPWERNGGFLLYLAAMFYVFLGFEIICDEFMVPALNLFCERLGMTDDFAGATLMGLGSCAPDVFSGVFGLLVLKTDVGAGTIVGSLLFNHLAILGGVCLAVPPFKVHVVSFVRETLFYTISLALLLGSLWDHKVTVWESTALLGTYVVFCVVCGFTTRISAFLARLHTRFLSRLQQQEDRDARQPLLVNDEPGATITVESAAAVAAEDEDKKAQAAAAAVAQAETQSPDARDPENKYGSLPQLPTATADSASAATATASTSKKPEETKEAEKANVRRLKEMSSRLFQTVCEEGAAQGRELPTGKALGLSYGDVHMHGFLEKKSEWYTKIRVSSRQWQKRWFVLDEGLWYCRNPLFPDVNRRVLPLWAAYRVDHCDPHDPRVFALFVPGGTRITLRAGTPARAEEWISCISRRISLQRESCPDLVREDGVVGIGTEEFDDEVVSLWTPPATLLRKVLWVLGLPLLTAFTITIPNVKIRRFRSWYVLTFLNVLVWLAAMSYGMLWCADRFALAVGIPADIMGLTITAIGASLPSFFGSIISARQGTTSMAVSNTFGANLSSILVAIGLPCFIHTAIIQPGHAQPIESQGILKTVLVLGAALFIFLVSLCITRMRFNRVLGIFYFFLYAALLSLVVVLEELHIDW